VLEERICGRWMHKASGRSYHVKFAPPKALKVLEDGKPDPASMLDDETGEPLYQRGDDTPEALKKRLDGYFGETVPILAHYSPSGAVKRVNANQDIELVYAETAKCLGLGARFLGGDEKKSTGGSIHTFTVKDIDGLEVKLSDFDGKVCLIVNVASK